MTKIKHVVAILLISCLFSPVLAQKKYALLIGINRYYDAPGVVHKPMLQGCVNDAKAMNNLLLERFGFEADNVTALYDAAATGDNVRAAFGSILRKCRTGDAFVFYFSGHGVYAKNDRQNRLELGVKDGLDQAMVFSDLYSAGLSCLITDSAVKRFFNSFLDKGVVPTAILDCCFAGEMAEDANPFVDNPYDYVEGRPGEKKELDFDDLYNIYDAYNRHISLDSIQREFNNDNGAVQKDTATSKAFRLKDALLFHDSTFIPRPASRKNSMFLSLAGTGDREEGLDAIDESGVRHGAYTAALLKVYSEQSSLLSVTELEQKMKQLLTEQEYKQTPMYVQGTARLSGNLIGIAPTNFTDRATAKCVGKKNGKFLLDKGLLHGVAIGNMLGTMSPGNKTTVRITAATADSAEAELVSGPADAIRANTMLQLTSAFVSSPPVVKVFIGEPGPGYAHFQLLMNDTIFKLAKLFQYADYEHWNKREPSENLFFNRANSGAAEKMKTFSRTPMPLLAFLPIPAFVQQAVRERLRHNQNVQIVDAEKDADISLCLLWSKAQPGYVFTWDQLPTGDSNAVLSLHFFAEHVKTASLDPHTKDLSPALEKNLMHYARTTTDRWLNMDRK